MTSKEIRKILIEHEKRIQKLEKIIKGKDEFSVERQRDEVKELKSIQNLAKKSKVHEKCLKELFDIENNGLTLLKIVGQDELEQTKNATLLVLLGYKYIFGNNEIGAKEIRRNVAENRVTLNNFATHLNKIIPKLVRRKGKLKSPRTKYKLTVPGEVEAKVLLQKICES